VHLLPHDVLREFAAALFHNGGVRDADARIVAGHLVEANLAGHDSHGVTRIAQYLAAIRSGEVSVSSTPRIIQRFAAGAVIDGERGFGQVIANKAVETATDLARTSGVAGVSVRNCYHTGRIGSYTEQMAERGMIGIAMVNAGGGGQSVAPFGGLSRRLATNPISIAAPTGGEFPLVLDIATSVAPEGKLRTYKQRQHPIPPGWIVDSLGKPSTDAADFYDSPGGALLPLGGAAGYKGFGLAMMIDVLAGALSGAGCCREGAAQARDGMLLLAIDVERFGPREAFLDRVGELIDYVKSSRAAPGIEEILVPGEPEFRQRQRRLAEGVLLDGPTWHRLVELATELHVPLPGSNRVLTPPNARATATGSIPLAAPH
jgi:uncharacterized oxidoreductase